VLFQRVLLALVTALVVARPLVPTEDPGLRSALPDASGMVLTWLWLVAGLGWAILHFWTRRDGQRIDLIEACLFGIVGLMFLSSHYVARYKFTAWLETWEWLSFVIVFCVVRRLASSPKAAHGLLSALLATGVMLSLYAGFQYFVEIPELAKRVGGSKEILQADMESQGVFRESDDPYWDQLAERLQARNVYATYAHPNSLAGFLGLLLPAALGCTLASWQRRGSWGITVGLGICTAVIGSALWWTHSRGSLLASVAVGIGVIALLGRRMIALHQARAVLGIVALVVLLGALAYFGTRERSLGKQTPTATLGLRLGYWKATWKMISYQPWLGVGPGNFGRHYPMYMSEKDYEEVQDPHNFALELWTSCGFFGMAALLLAVATLFRKLIVRRASKEETDLAHGEGTVQDTAPRTPWEFYLGGIAGLILGFLLSSWHQSADEKLLAGVAAGIRSLFWFPAFALFFSLRWSGSVRTLALGAGLAVLLLNLCLSGGISVPAVAQPLWIVAAIALAPATSGAAEYQRAGSLAFLVRLLPIPILGGLGLIYSTMFLEPVATGAHLARLALRAENYLPVLNDPTIEGVPENIKEEIRRNPRAFVDHSVLRPLQLAAEANPGDSRYQISLANWTGVLWQLVREDPRYGDTIRDNARSYALKCQAMDPLNREGFLAEARLNAMFAAHSIARSWRPTLAVSVPWGPFPQMLPLQPLGCFVLIREAPFLTPAWKTAHLEYDQAATALGHAVDLSPTQPFVRFEYMGALISAGHFKEAERQANELLHRDRMAAHKSRRLTDPQREHVYRWLQTRQTR
jgi:hypothetical protein